MGLFSKKDERGVERPEMFEPVDPVNYNSVLDYLVGLSKPEYDKMIKVTGIYRDANKSAAKVLGIKDEPITTIKNEAPSEESIDQELDSLLDTDIPFLTDDEPDLPKPKKSQATDKKIAVSED